MFLDLGGGELFFIFLIILLLFGAKSIPDFARSMGRGLRQIRNATDDIRRDIEGSVNDVRRDLDITRKEYIAKRDNEDRTSSEEDEKTPT